MRDREEVMKMKTDLIRKEDAIKAIFDWMDTHKKEVIHKQDITDVIMPLSEETIRCKDCKRWNTIVNRAKAEYGLCQIRSQLEATSRNDYCSRAERKENG